MTSPAPNTPASEPRQASRRTAWLILVLIGAIGIFLLAGTRWRHSEILGYGVILVGSILGIEIARSMDRKTLFGSIVGGAVGCAILVGVSAFLQPLLLLPEPGTYYKFGGGISSAIAGLLLGLLLGLPAGGVVGFVAGLVRKIGGR